MTPEEELELAELEELERLEAEEAAAAPPSPDQKQADQLAPLVDPNLSLPAQVLATQPATTHPQGDEAAQSDWAVKGTDAAKGTTIVYEPPVAKARKDLLENQQLLRALFPDEQIPPEFIQQMDENSDIYKTYADHKWNEARWAAADSGTTAYRQSKMPWLHGESAGLSPISTLVTKLRASIDPALEGAQAFVLGIDDTAAFGAGRRAGEALDRATPTDPKGAIAAGNRAGDAAVRGGAAVGGVGEEAQSGADPEAVNEMLIEESPGAHTAGQIVGMFTPGGVLGLLGKGAAAATRGAGALAARLGGGAVAQGGAKLAGAGAATAVGGGAVQAGREGVEAGANLAKTGETGTTLGEAAGRVQSAALDPVNLALGVGGEAAGMLLGAGARAIADSPRYGGNIERVKQLGGDIKFGRGPVGNEATDRAIAAGKARDITPTAVMVEELAPKIAEAENAVASGNFAAAKEAKEAVKRSHAGFKSKYFASPEGQTILPPVATMETNLKHLRNKMTTTPEGGLRPVGNAEGVATARAEFSGDVADVSLTPKPGAIELTPDEAEMFLVPALTNKLVPKRKGTPPVPPAPSGGPGPGAPPGVNKQGVNVLKPQSVVPVGEAPTVPPKGKAAKPAGVVGKPTIKTPPEYLEARDEYGRATADYRSAQQRDNARAAQISKEFGASRSREEVAEALKKALTPEELTRVGGYSHGRFFEINDALRGQSKMTPEIRKTVDEIDSVLTKAIERGHTYEGPTQRGLQLSADEVKQLDSAGTVTAQGFMSSSTESKIAKHFAATGGSTAERQVPVLFEIQQRSGVPLGKKQGEIIHRPGTEFRITGKRMDGDTHVFQVEEIGHKPRASSEAAKAGAIIGGGILSVGAAAASGDDSGGAALASAGGLALALKKRGVSKVYVTPRRYNAQQHEVRIGQLKDLTKDPKMPGAREAKERYAAALQDRGQRPLDGKPGGWSEAQQQVSERLTALDERIMLAEKEATRKAAAKRDAPGGTAASRLARYSKQRDNELPLKKEIEDAGARAGVTEDLKNLRLLDPLEQLRGTQSYRGKVAPRSKMGLVGAAADAAALRLVYPTLNAASSQLSPLRGGLLGTRALQLKDDEKEAR